MKRKRKYRKRRFESIRVDSSQDTEKEDIKKERDQSIVVLPLLLLARLEKSIFINVMTIESASEICVRVCCFCFCFITSPFLPEEADRRVQMREVEEEGFRRNTKGIIKGENQQQSTAQRFAVCCLSASCKKQSKAATASCVAAASP